ncbi:DMT family transporter [Pseudaestuariivita sp.]|uniref:DMT family transporter n=1 Tax=Pseudaestuariivita sp. TaxID=2211669 RepID=UPI004058E591
MTEQGKGLLITLVGVLCVVPDALFIKLIEAPGLTVSFWRGITSGAGLVLSVLILMGPGAFGRVLRAGPPAWLYMAAAGGSGILFVLAVKSTSVANVVFIIAAMPIFAAVFSRLFLGEPISRRMLWTMAAVVPGLALIAYGSGETEGAHWSGDVLALCVAALFAAGLTAARQARAVSMVPGVAVAYLASSAALIPFVDPWAVPDDQWRYVALHGVFITVSATGLALGPRYITSAEVALLILLESVLAPVLVWAVIGEAPGRWAIAGGAVVIAALAVSNLAALRNRRSRPAVRVP